MKKILTLVAFIAAISLPAQAQFNFGVKGGLNVSKLSLDKKVLTSDNQMGFFIGPTVKFTIPVINLGFDAAALFDQRSGEFEYDNTSTKLKLQSFQIPINVRWGFGIGDVVNLYIFAGPQFGFNLGDKVTSLLNNGAEWQYEKNSVSGNAGLGVTLLNHLQVSVNYNMSFNKSGNLVVMNENGERIGYNGDKVDAKMNTWQIALAYYF